MKTNFEVGDVVRLKSGGLPMTVSKIDGETITCIWFSVSWTDVVCMDFNPVVLVSVNNA